MNDSDFLEIKVNLRLRGGGILKPINRDYTDSVYECADYLFKDM